MDLVANVDNRAHEFSRGFNALQGLHDRFTLAFQVGVAHVKDMSELVSYESVFESGSEAGNQLSWDVTDETDSVDVDHLQIN